MHFRYLIFLSILIISSNTVAQNISIHSISTVRQPSGDNGYTLDGHLMNESGRKKLLNPNYFGENGIYNKSVTIFDGYGTTGSITSVSSIPKNLLFFFASFNNFNEGSIPFIGLYFFMRNAASVRFCFCPNE